MHKPDSSSSPKNCYILQRRNYEGPSDEGQLEIIACYDRFENAQKHGEVVVRQIYSAWNRARKLLHRRQRIRKNGAVGLGGNGFGNGANGNVNGMEVVYCLDGGDDDDVLCRVVVSVTEMRVLGGFGDRESEERDGNVIGYLDVEEFEEGARSESERDDGVVDGDDVKERAEPGGCTIMACWCDETVARRERMKRQTQPTTQPTPHPPQQVTPLNNNVRRSTDSITGHDARTTSNPLGSTSRATAAQSVTTDSTQQPTTSQTRIARPGASNFLAGKIFSVTRLPPIDRDQIISMITQYGGSLVSWMDRPRRSTVDFIITVTDCRENFKKRAEEYNVTQLTPEEFFNMISTSLASMSKPAASSGNLGSKRGIEEVDSCDNESPESKRQRKTTKTKTRLEKEASDEYRFRCAFPGCKSIYNRRDNLTQHIKKKGHYAGGDSAGGAESDENGAHRANGTNGGTPLRNESEVQDSIVVVPRSMTSVFLASQNVNTALIPNRVKSSLALKDGAYSKNYGTVRTIGV